MGIKIFILILSTFDGIIIYFFAEQWRLVGILNFIVAFIFLVWLIKQMWDKSVEKKAEELRNR